MLCYDSLITNCNLDETNRWTVRSAIMEGGRHRPAAGGAHRQPGLVCHKSSSICVGSEYYMSLLFS